MKRILLAGVALLLLPFLAVPAIAVAYISAQADAADGCEPAGADAIRLIETRTTNQSDDPGSATTPCPTAAHVTGSAPAFTGTSTGCTVPHPSGTGGCVTPALAALMAQVQARFGKLSVSCWSARGGDPYSDHPKGKACDYTIGRIGTYPAPIDVARGWTLADWLRSNAVPLNIDYVIWQGRIWSRAYTTQGWRTYTGGGVYSTTGPTNGHYDHVHVSTTD